MIMQMKKWLFLVCSFSVLFSSTIFAVGKDRSYCLIYVSVDNESDLKAVADRVSELTDEAQTSGSQYLLFISRGSNPIVSTKAEEAKSKINEIFSFGTKPGIYVDLEIKSLFREISRNDFSTLDSNLRIKYLVNNIRFHFIVNKSFLSLNYQQKMIGKFLSCCMMDKVKEQDCIFSSTIYFGKGLSAKESLDQSFPLGSIFPFNYSNYLTDDK